MLISILVFIFTLLLVIWQPRGLGIGWGASIGALIALALGVVQLSDIPVVWAIVWNATATFIADTASLPLIVSNLVNIVSADYFSIRFNEYATVMMPVNLVSVVASLAVLLWFFKGDIPHRYQINQLPLPASAIKDLTTFKAGWMMLVLLLAGFFVLDPLGVPVSVVAAVGAVLLLTVAARGTSISIKKVLHGAPWQIVVFSLGMYLVVYGLRNAGLTDYLALLLSQFAEGGIWGAAIGTGVLSALLSSVMNNMPTVLTTALSIESSAASGVIKEAMIYANVIGSDLGPKFTPIGSLATLLWLHVLAQKDMTIGWGYYFRVGVVLTTPVLLVTLIALALRLGALS